MFIEVFIEKSLSNFDRLYTYECDFLVEPGMRVHVPFGKGNRSLIGLVVRINVENESKKLKKVIDVIDDEPIINKDLIDLGFWMKDKYLKGYYKSFQPILPPGDYKFIEVYAQGDEKQPYGHLLNRNIYDLKAEERKLLKDLKDKGQIKFFYKVKTQVKEKFISFYKLNENYLDFTFSEKLSEPAKNVIKYLATNGEKTKKEILRDLQISDSPLKTLIKKNIIEESLVKDQRNPYEKQKEYRQVPLNMEQVKAYKGILETKKETSLLYGKTGSGKTEVYLRLSKEIIDKGGQVIILVPEIGLTPQMIERFMGRFPGRVSILHSRLSPGERFDQYMKIKNDQVDIVVGARSAVFSPLKNLKLIVIDEEHDSSYRFSKNNFYDTREVALKRMEGRGKVVLGSATPSIESFKNAQENKYQLFKLKNRAVEGARLPKVDIADMREELFSGNLSIFSNKLYKLMEEKLSKNEQIILFLNRRGFSNFVSCRSCGYVIKCDNCDISMTYHKDMNHLRCHYCGSVKQMVKTCPNCGSKYLKQFGIGTQRVEMEVKKAFPKAKVFRMDRDTMNKKNSYDEVYELVKNHEVDILIGTQMLAKGFDFENVTLVGIIAADMSLYISDYRAQATTFELITQVSGRAGRSEKQGNVVIQTYNPDNYSIVNAAKSDYENFYKDELQVRKISEYPPFTKLYTIVFSSREEKAIKEYAEDFLKDLIGELKNISAVRSRLINIPKIKNIYRQKVLIKVDPRDEQTLLNALKGVINKKEINNIKIDIEME